MFFDIIHIKESQIVLLITGVRKKKGTNYKRRHLQRIHYRLHTALFITFKNNVHGKTIFQSYSFCIKF